MIRESKYIIRRILIGVGIVLVLSFVKSCNVKALVNNSYISDNYSASVNLSNVSSNSDNSLLVNYEYISVYKNSVNNDIYFCNQTKCIWYKISNTSFTYSNIGIFLSTYPQYPNNYSSYYTSSVYLCDGNLPHLTTQSAGYRESFSNSCMSLTPVPVGYTGVVNNAGYYLPIYTNENNISSSITMQPLSRTNNNGNKVIQAFATTEWNYLDNNYIPSDNIINTSSLPEFVSWHATKISSNDVLTGYSFRPEFSVWDTDNYIYSYKYGNSSWLSLTENEQIFRVNANGTVYVQVKDKNTNEVIDSATFTITQVGNFVNEQTYSINFSGDYRTYNYINDNVSSRSKSVILEYEIYTDFQPKSSILKYQYQYVNSGNSLDNNAWIDINISDLSPTFDYVATVNGTLYVRILDSEDNVLISDSFEVDSIGMLAFDNNSKIVGNFLQKLSSNINYGGPISSLIGIPVNLLTTILDAINGSTGVCYDYNLGSLWGTSLKLPCVDIKSYLGNSLYSTIDIICSCVMIYFIIKMLLNAYDKFLNLQRSPILSDGEERDD